MRPLSFTFTLCMALSARAETNPEWTTPLFLAQRAGDIPRDDFRANIAQGFLSLVKGRNLEEAFERMDHDTAGARVTFDEFVRFIEGFSQ